MIRELQRCVAATAMLLAGCASIFTESAPLRYHALVVPPAPGTSGCAVRFGLRPVGIPGYVDRNEVIVDRRGSELVLSPDDLWAAPLKGEITRALGEALAVRWTGSRYVAHPWRFGETPPWSLQVVFERLDPEAGVLAVRARWALTVTADGSEIADGRADTQVGLESSGARATATAIGRAVGELADRIAVDVRTGLRPREVACGQAAAG